MMPTPPPRRRFQIHLSTAIVLMFVAGGLMWANVTQQTYLKNTSPPSPTHYTVHGYIVQEYGWPYSCHKIERSSIQLGDKIWPPVETQSTHYNCAAWNLGFALLILYSVWFVLESLIRRRASKKGP